MRRIDHLWRRDSMAEHVKQKLLRRIMSGEIPPGVRLAEMHIAHDLNTSQALEREALRELKAVERVR
jgi:DNA-binding GntR family transcriptional regulator